jgi:hypothetical protein
MAKLGNYARDVETGDPFTTGNATVKAADGSTLASPALNATTGRWEYIANGQPGKVRQEYAAAGQTKIIEGDAYGQAGDWFEAELSRILQLFGSGVIQGLAVTAPGGMAVEVGEGDLLNLGVLHPIYDAESVDIDTAHATLDRIDVVASELTRTGTFAGKVELVVVKGTADATPDVPDLTQDDDTWQIEVARVAVPAAAGSIVSDNISTAERPIATGPISDGSVTTAKLADDSVTSAKIDDGTILLEDLNAEVVSAFQGGPGLINTYWITSLGAVGGSAGSIGSALVQNVLYGAPIFIPKATTITGVALNRLSGTSTDATLRFGLYGITSAGLPGARVADFGTVSVGGTNGVKSITGLSVAVDAGWYWAAVCAGTFTGTVVPTNYGSAAGSIPMQILGAADAGSLAFLVAAQGVFVGTGALPDPYPSPGLSETGPLIWVQTSGT